MANPMSDTSQFLPGDAHRNENRSELEGPYPSFKQGTTAFNSAENLHDENQYFTQIKHGVDREPATCEATGLRTQRAKE